MCLTLSVQVVCELLCEMNPDVKGSSRVGNFQNLLETEPEYFLRFNLVIAANIPRYQLERLASLCWKEYIPLLCLRCVGFLGSIHLQAREHFVVEARGDSERHDLRVSSPFNGFRELLDEVLPPLSEYALLTEGTEGNVGEHGNVTSFDSHEYSHIPYPLILARALTIWQQRSGSSGDLPRSAAEKDALKCIVKGLELVPGQRNIEEALREIRRCWEPPLPSVVTDPPAMEDAQTAQERLWSFAARLGGNDSLLPSHAATRKHRLLLRALVDFVKQNGRLPVGGALPDCTATSRLYTQLQFVFHRQAQQDRASFESILSAQLSHHEVDRRGLQIHDEDIASLCRGPLALGLLATPPLFVSSASGHVDGDVARGGGLRDAVEELLDSPNEEGGADLRQSPALWFVALEAAERFYARHFRQPGDVSASAESEQLGRDAGLLLDEMHAIARELELSEALFAPRGAGERMDVEGPAEEAAEDALIGLAHAVEIVRYGGAQLHNLASLLGGVAAQEAVKLTTQIFVPLDNVYVVNGIAGVAAAFRF